MNFPKEISVTKILKVLIKTCMLSLSLILDVDANIHNIHNIFFAWTLMLQYLEDVLKYKPQEKVP